MTQKKAVTKTTKKVKAGELNINPQALIKLAIEKGSSIETMERLLDMRKRLRDEQAEIEFREAMSYFQAHCPIIEKKKIVKDQAAGLLAKTDWYVVKATEVADYTVPANITTYRAAVRAKSNEMETAIDGAANVDALKTLYEYTDDGNGNITRPLGEWPEEVI